ncbi:MAG: tRNA pseudouridine(38-40) synthase TruA [Cellulomonas sp.]|uniref:tRNA pseudouridine(38-40) synthase TruA n=1 Tax=Cellulomonas sp. TaxID=40001 RepID=UPI0018227AD6|nr:tRNA pseudouridine(38-40) synthase TruA [Cellulomonas sp.]NMM29994.1 tRNA pseudouridine(38-40) synthase TruA [Cellulomonas sp.]
MNTVRLRLDLAYDGTRFAGWAVQPALRTVQGVLEEALATVLHLDHLRITVAGRTDAGVHARGQVAHVDVAVDTWLAAAGRSSRSSQDVLVTRLGGLLPPDVVVHRVRVAHPGFDARFSALGRRYVYRVCDDATLRDPLRRSHVLWHSHQLDNEAMDAAARALLGRHDFAAFCKPRVGATTIRTLEMLTWQRPVDGPDAGLVVAHVQADAFCHSMVRALVGASLAVGEERRQVRWPADILAGRQRDPGNVVAPALGLTLEQVTYPPDDELAGRAELTRSIRSAEDVDSLRRDPDAAAGSC